MAKPGRVSVMGLAALALAALLAVSPAPRAAADELDTLFAGLLINPADIDLNLRYARLAEERGLPRKALAAYERVLLHDPDNREAREGYERIRIALEPAYTDVTVSIGTRYESNVRQQSDRVSRPDDVVFRGQVDLRDERTLFARRWRTEGYFLGDLHADVEDLDYARVDAVTGPVFDLGPSLRLHTAAGGAYATLDGHELLAEAAIKIGIEGILEGALDKLDVRVAYRDIASRFSDAEGLVVDVVGRVSRAGLLADSDVLVIYPRFRYSEPTSTGTTLTTPDRLFPGDYFQFGASGGYYFPLDRTVLLGATFNGYYRDYDQQVRSGGKQREDVFLAPGAQLIFKDVLGPKTRLWFEYRFENNLSNDGFEDFENHVVGVRASKTF